MSHVPALRVRGTRRCLVAACAHDAVPSTDDPFVSAAADPDVPVEIVTAPEDADVVTDELFGREWIVSQTVRDIDGLPSVVVYCSANEVSGISGGGDIVRFLEFSPIAFQRLRLVADACDWQLDAYLAAVEFETDALRLLEEQRASVLEWS